MSHRRQTDPKPFVARALALALGLLLVPAATALRAEESAAAPPGPAPAAAQEGSASARRPAAVPDREEMRRRVDELISFDELLAAQERANVDEAPVSFRCEAVRRPGAPAISPRRSSRLTFLDARGLCYGACMISCLSVGVPFNDCDEVCDDVCYGGSASVASAPAEPPRSPAELQPLVARGAEVVSPDELAKSEPRRLIERGESAFRCNEVACTCKGGSDCLALADAGVCADFICSAGPECACNRKTGT